MSEIAPKAVPGWYNDAAGLLRWWDGNQWGPYAPQAVNLAAGQVVTLKSVGTAYLFLLLLGGFAAHHVYLRNTGPAVLFLVLWRGGWATTVIGVGYMLLAAAAAVSLLVDLFILPAEVRAENDRILRLGASR